jgi:type I restriction enzyme S subunit
VGVIPEEWELRPLLSTVRIANGQVDPKTEPFKSMILIAPDHIESATGRLLERQTASDQRAISGKYLFSQGDIVYSKIRPYLRKAIVAEIGGLCSADMYPLKPAKDVSSGFMLAVLLGHRFSKYAESVSVRSGIPKINRAELAGYVVALPRYPEQRAIAGALGDVDALLGALTQLITKKRDLKQATMQQLLTGQTRLAGFSGELESRELRSFVRDFVVPMRDKPRRFSGDIPWCRIEDFDGKYLSRSRSGQHVDQQTVKEMNLKVYPVGTLLVSCSADLGRCAIVGRPLVTNQTFIGLVLDGTVSSSEFLYYYMSYRADQLNTLSSGTTISYLSREQFEIFPVLIPSKVSEQAAIAAVLSDMDAELTVLEQRLAKTHALKQGMIQELLTGRTRLV